jgi:Tfp pilus assembly protein PilF
LATGPARFRRIDEKWSYDARYLTGFGGMLIFSLAEEGARGAAEQRVVARVPADSITHTLLGIAYLSMNAVEMAKASFAKALAIDPATAGARQGLAEAEAVAKKRSARQD